MTVASRRRRALEEAKRLAVLKEKDAFLPKVTTDSLFEKFMELDVDASGRISHRELGRFLAAGDDLRHRFVADFDTADTGISWREENGTVVVGSIEVGSPAADNPDVAVGLELASANGIPAPEERNVKAVRRMWRQFPVHEATRIEFYEPFLIAHDFANALDFEITLDQVPTAPPARMNRTLKASAMTAAATKGKSAFFQFLLSNKKSVDGARDDEDYGDGGDSQAAGSKGAATTSTASSDASRRRIVATAKLASRAYALPNDVERALRKALAKAAPQYFDSEDVSAVRVRDGQVAIALKKGAAAKFRMLGTAGPSRFSSMHRHIGFANEPSEIPADCQLGETLSSLKLGFRLPEHVRAFTAELMREFDANLNNYLEFDEFRNLYFAHLSSTDAIRKLRDRVKCRFRTDEELREIARLEEQKRRRDVFRKNIEKNRERNAAIRQDQRERIMAQSFRDCDNTLRRVIRTTRDVLPAERSSSLPKQRRRVVRRPQLVRRDERLRLEAETAKEEEARAAQAIEWRRCHHARHLVGAGFDNVFVDIDDNFRVRNDICHPAFACHARRRESARNTADRHHPAFFGLTRAPIERHFVGAACDRGLCMVKNLLKPSPTSKWRACLAPPLCRGVARQRFRSLTMAHDRSEIIHPAFWGWAVAPKSCDAATTSPVTNGYELQRQVFPKKKGTRRGVALAAALPIKHVPAGGGAVDPLLGAAGGFDDDAEVCHICLGGGLGCPFCFEIPKCYEPKDFAYAPNSVKRGNIPHLHTDLTTTTAIAHHRHRRTRIVDILIKAMPCGEIVRLRLETTHTVDHLHHLFRANCTSFSAENALMYLPTENGLVTVDVDDPLARLEVQNCHFPMKGDVPISKYGLGSENDRAVFFHGTSRSIVEVIRVFMKSNLLVEEFILVDRVVHHVENVPLALEKDILQSKLWDFFVLQEFQHFVDHNQDQADHFREKQLEAKRATRTALLSKIDMLQKDRKFSRKQGRMARDKLKIRQTILSIQDRHASERSQILKKAGEDGSRQA